MFLRIHREFGGRIRGFIVRGFVLAAAVAFQISFARAGEIKAQFMEDGAKITIEVDSTPIMSTERFRDHLLSLLTKNKIDCGPNCIPKPVEDGIWECCDGRRIPPKGKVRLTVSEGDFRSAVKAAFTASSRESNPQ